MDTAVNPRAVPGDNSPPDPLIAEMNERIDNANRWLKERPDWEQWDLEMADKANFFIEQIGATWSALDERRLEEGREFKKKQDAFYKDPLTLLTMAKDKMVKLRREWLKRDEDRMLAEKAAKEAAAKEAAEAAEAAQKKAEKAATAKGGDPLRAELAAQKAADVAVAAAAAAEAAPDKARISGTYSSRAKGLQDYWSAEVTDVSLAFKHYNAKGNPNRALIAAAVLEVIQSIATAEAKRIKDETAAPPGIKFKKDRR